VVRGVGFGRTPPNELLPHLYEVPDRPGVEDDTPGRHFPVSASLVKILAKFSFLILPHLHTTPPHCKMSDFQNPETPQNGPEPEARKSCIICLNALSDPKTLECRHSFCRDCINQWLSVANNCPTCRRQAPGEFDPDFGFTTTYVRINGKLVARIEFLEKGEGVVEMYQDSEGRWRPRIILD